MLWAGPPRSPVGCHSSVALRRQRQDRNSSGRKPSRCTFYQNFQVPRKKRTDGIKLPKVCWKLPPSLEWFVNISFQVPLNLFGDSLLCKLHWDNCSIVLQRAACRLFRLHLSALLLSTSYNETEEFQAKPSIQSILLVTQGLTVWDHYKEVGGGALLSLIYTLLRCFLLNLVLLKACVQISNASTTHLRVWKQVKGKERQKGLGRKWEKSLKSIWEQPGE